MKPAYTLDQVREILRRHFGSVWEAGYEKGRSDMAGWLVERLKMPLETTTRAIQEMERKGMLRFERSALADSLEAVPGELGQWSIEEMVGAPRVLRMHPQRA